MASAIASPVANYAIHEKREAAPEGWSKRETLDRRAIMPMRIALAQRNLDKAWEYLESVSHPSSTKYGQHWSAKEVAETFAPRFDDPILKSCAKVDELIARIPLPQSRNGSPPLASLMSVCPLLKVATGSNSKPPCPRPRTS